MARMLSLDANCLKKPNGESNGQQQLMDGADQQMGDSHAPNWRLLGFGFFFLFYLALGASVFSAIEAPLESKAVASLLDHKRAFLRKYPCLEDDALEDFMSSIVEANNRGVSIFKNGSSVPSWSFGQSFFFASTVVTTIGYGHQSPLSSEGKLFCMAYALVGIPMTLVLLTALVDRMLAPVNFLLAVMNGALGHRFRPMSIALLHFALVMLVVLVVFFLIPAAIFSSIETGWNYLDALYYCFISLTTIGLGDFIPGDSPGQPWRPFYKACTTFYLLVGVTVMMMALAVFNGIPQFDCKILLLRPCGGGGDGTACGGDGRGANTSGNTDPERIHLHAAKGRAGPRYTQHIDEQEEVSPFGAIGHPTMVVRARSRPSDDSPSPVEETSAAQQHRPF